MIDEEDSSSPTSDGEIRKAFIQMSGVHIKLKPVKQLRESLGIPRQNNARVILQTKEEYNYVKVRKFTLCKGS